MKQAIGAIGGICLLSFLTLGCAGGSLSTREKGAGVGALGGAAAGGIVGAAVGIRVPERRSAGLLDSGPAYWLGISCKARKTVKRISNGRSTPIKPRFSASAGIWKHCGAKANTSCFV